MGIFVNNRTKLGNGYDTVIANENYSGIEGAMQILIDGARNDQALFEALIATDMMEIELINCNESTKIMALQEASTGGIFERIKEFLEKMWKKLKGLVLSFIDKLKAKFTSDNVKLVNKFAKAVRKKTFSKNFTYKYSERDCNFTPNKDLDTISSIIKNFIGDKDLGDLDTYDTNEKLDTRIKGLEKEISNGKVLKDILNTIASTNNATSDNFSEKFHKKMYKTEKECRGLDSSRLSKIIKNLEDSKDAISTAKELASDLDEFCKNLIEYFDDKAEEYGNENENKRHIFDDIYAGDNKKTDLSYNNAFFVKRGTNLGKGSQIISYSTVKAGVAAKIATIYSKLASVAQTAATKYTTAYLKEIKFGIAQDRKVFIKAVGWRDSQNESYEDNNILFTAIDEMVDYELSELI